MRTCAIVMATAIGVTHLALVVRINYSVFLKKKKTKSCILVPLGTIGATCSSNYQCYQAKMLSCQSGTCQCPASPFFWSTVLLKCTQCPSGWDNYNNRCYYYPSGVSGTWFYAGSYCSSLGATRLIVANAADYSIAQSFCSWYGGVLWVTIFPPLFFFF